MDPIANLLFEARILKEIPRSGYHFLGAGRESVAEHSFLTAFIAYVMTEMEPEADKLKLISMCLVHDLPEARTGDLNYVNKLYAKADEGHAVEKATENIPFGSSLKRLVQDFNEESFEADLAHDADQLAFIIDLKALSDIGYDPPKGWLPAVAERLKTETGKNLYEKILETRWDAWWRQKYIDSPVGKQ